jgi:hypothetical protein
MRSRRLPFRRRTQIADELARGIAGQVTAGLERNSDGDRSDELERARAALVAIGLTVLTVTDDVAAKELLRALSG